MACIVQISDLHLFAFPTQQQTTIDPLIDALASARARLELRPDLLAITGDVFDTSALDRDDAVSKFAALLVRIRAALGTPAIPTVILPGNHDRRWNGILGHFDPRLFESLHDAIGEHVWIVGNTIPYLADVIPAEFHKLPHPVVTFDTTYNPTGLVGAGGVVREEDLLQLADRIRDERKDGPLLVLAHHHLIPTPLTDWARVDIDTENKILRWVVKNVVAKIISNADHEELTMTALGAGTALSVFHAFDRALIVLHGHKHNPAARALHATMHGQGDILLAAAGSAGTILTWNATDDPDVAHLWPSFSVCHLDDASVAVDSVAFSPRRTASDTEPTRIAVRSMLRARRHGVHWSVEPVKPEPENVGPVLARNVSTHVLAPNAARGATRWDIVTDRSVLYESGPALESYAEVEEGANGGRLVDFTIGAARLPDRDLPASLRLPVDGTPVRFRLSAGACKTLDEAKRGYGELTAFEWVDLLNRYACREAVLVLEGLPGKTLRPFGSAVDLTTGLERPIAIERTEGRAVLRMRDCPPRTLLKILWPLR